MTDGVGFSRTRHTGLDPESIVNDVFVYSRSSTRKIPAWGPE